MAILTDVDLSFGGRVKVGPKMEEKPKIKEEVMTTLTEWEGRRLFLSMVFGNLNYRERTNLTPLVEKFWESGILDCSNKTISRLFLNPNHPFIRDGLTDQFAQHVLYCDLIVRAAMGYRCLALIYGTLITIADHIRGYLAEACAGALQYHNHLAPWWNDVNLEAMNQGETNTPMGIQIRKTRLERGEIIRDKNSPAVSIAYHDYYTFPYYYTFPFRIIPVGEMSTPEGLFKMHWGKELLTWEFDRLTVFHDIDDFVQPVLDAMAKATNKKPVFVRAINAEHLSVEIGWPVNGF